MQLKDLWHPPVVQPPLCWTQRQVGELPQCLTPGHHTTRDSQLLEQNAFCYNVKVSTANTNWMYNRVFVECNERVMDDGWTYKEHNILATDAKVAQRSQEALCSSYADQECNLLT